MLSLIYFLTSTLHKPPLRHSIPRAVLRSALSDYFCPLSCFFFTCLNFPFLAFHSYLFFTNLLFSLFSLVFSSPFLPSFVCSSIRKAFQSVERERELLRQTVHTADVMSALVSCSYNFIFSYLILSDLISSCPISSCPISFHPISSCPISFHPILSHFILSYHILSHFILSHLILSYHILSHFILSHLVQSHPILSHFITSCLIPSHPISFFFF